METTNPDQQVDELLAEEVRYATRSADSLKALLSNYSEETTVGKIIRMLLRWEHGEIGAEGYQLFRGIIVFHVAGVLQGISSFVCHDLLDDGGVGLVVAENGARMFVRGDETISNDVILAEMLRAEYAYTKAQAMRAADVLRRLIGFIEAKKMPISESLRNKLAALEAV